MGCGCRGARGNGTRPAAGTVIGWYAIRPDGTEIPKISAGEKPFLSRFQAKASLGTGGGTIRSVKQGPAR